MKRHKKKEEQTSPRKDAAMERERGEALHRACEASALDPFAVGSSQVGQHRGEPDPGAVAAAPGCSASALDAFAVGRSGRGQRGPPPPPPTGWSAGANVGQTARQHLLDSALV